MRTLPRRAPRLAALGLALATAGLVVTTPTQVQAQSEADLPPCDPSASITGTCRLGTWPSEGPAALPTPFGAPRIDASVWVGDPAGDAPSGGLDILAVGATRVEVADAASLRRASDVLLAGPRREAIRDGEAILVRLVLASRPDAIAEGHAGVFVATDVDGVLSNDAPSGVEAPDAPFAGFQEVFSLNVAAGEEPDLLFSDLSRGWYRGREAFAAHRPAPEVLDIVVQPERFGESLRAATFSESPAGEGYDVVGVGPTLATIPLDGILDVAPTCLEASVSTDPFVVERLVENGQTFRDIETPRSWSATATFALTDEERGALEALIAAGDTDGDGAIDLAGELVLVEEGLNVRQAPRLSLRVADGGAVLGIQAGITRRGFIVLRDLEIEPTGDGTADAVLGRAADALATSVPPFRVARRGGPVLLSAAAPCLVEAAPPSA